MNAYSIVHGWAIERAHELRKAADRAEKAYTLDPMRHACSLYAASLRAAAADIETAARVIIAQPASQRSSPAPEEP